MRRRIRSLRRRSPEKGATLPFLAIVLVFLLGMAAFATDLGWWYLNSIRIQRAADGAALAGVIHMPGFFATAETAAWDIASRNGYPNGIDGTVVIPEPVSAEPHQLRVTISDQVATFFLKLFGFDEITITKEAIAEYVTALPMGSPENAFGVGGAQEYRAAIQAQFTEKEDGDPFATQCELSFGVDSCGPGGTANLEHRPGGYRYGIEVPVGSGITQFQVQIYDAGFYPGSEPGDARCGSAQPGCNTSTAPGPTTRYTQYDVDDSPLDHFDNPVASCGNNPLVIAPETGPYEETWTTLCSIAVSGPTDIGVYPLQVQTDGGNGMNMYGIRACSPTCDSPSGTQPRVYGINDISIWADASGATPEFYFAEVDDVHAGKVLLLSLFDPGDANAGSMTILGPDDSPWQNCHVSFDSWTHGQNHDSFQVSGPCTIETTRTTNNCGQVNEPPGCRYNGDWMTVEMAIPNTYTCNPLADPSGNEDCWWKIRYNYSGAVFDRTTWAARVVGNPVHLVFEKN